MFSFEGIDLERRRFRQADVLEAAGIGAKTLENWVAYRLIPAMIQSPGKGRQRLYTGFEVFGIAAMGWLVEQVRLSPSEARKVASQLVHIVRPLVARDFKRATPDSLQVYVAFYPNGDLVVLDTSDRDAYIRASMGTRAVFIVPAERWFVEVLVTLCRRVYGAEWNRKKDAEAAELLRHGAAPLAARPEADRRFAASLSREVVPKSPLTRRRSMPK